MALERRYCVNHPERMAIGVCVETGKPVCGECSTRYNGVNYSREGLEIMHRRRREELARVGGAGWISLVLAGLVMSGVLATAYTLFGRLLTEWLRSR